MAACSILVCECVCNAGSRVTVLSFIVPSGTPEDSDTKKVRSTALYRRGRVKAHQSGECVCCCAYRMHDSVVFIVGDA